MRELQAAIIEELGVKASINPAEEVRSRVDFLKDYLAATGAKGFVLGISGRPRALVSLIPSILVGILARLIP